MRNIGIAFLSLIVLLGSTGPIYSETSNRVVAIINDEVITLYELNKRIEEITGQRSEDIRAVDENRFHETRRQILELMINEKIAQEKIIELGIQVTQNQIDAAIENIKKANRLTQEDLLENLKREGITYDKYRETVKNQLERIRLINHEVKSKILIRDEQIVQYYQEHQDLYKVEPEIRIAGIFLKPENPGDERESEELKKKVDDLLARLRNGEDFGKLAKEFSQGPGADEGGDLGVFKITEIDPALLKELKKLPDNGISDPIYRDNVIQIIKLIKWARGGVKPLEEVRDSIYETLFNKEVDERYASWIEDLRENTFTKIIF